MTARTDGLPDTPEAADPQAGGGMSRRKMITVGSFGVVGLAGLAACGGGSSAGSAVTGAGTATTGSSGSATSAAAAATTLTKLSAVPVGGAIGLTVGGKPVIVAQPTSGDAVAFSAICPHQGCTVAASGTSPLACPCHGSTFDVKTGKNLSGPAPKPLTALAVEVTGGNVVLKS